MRNAKPTFAIRGRLFVVLGAVALPTWGGDRDPQDVRQGRPQRSLERLEVLGGAPLSSGTVSTSPRTVTPPGAYDLSLAGDFKFGGYMFKDGYPFLHNDGGPTAYNTALGLDALVSSTPGIPGGSSGRHNTATGARALMSNTEGFLNTAVGAWALQYNTLGSDNTAVGGAALWKTTGTFNTGVGSLTLFNNTTGGGNTAVGGLALFDNEEGDGNTAVGSLALYEVTEGDNNTAIGSSALQFNTGSDNIALGAGAGAFVGSGDDNILIGNQGSAGDANVIKIGDTDQTSTFIDGIFGATSSGGTQVFINDLNQLGTSMSSRRFKEEVEDMGDRSASLGELRPVTFRYTAEAAGSGPRPVEFGLIAEEVAEIYPDLVVYDDHGEPYSVRYHVLTPMLLNELQRLRRQVVAMESRNREFEELQDRFRALEAWTGDVLERVGRLEASRPGSESPQR